MEQDHIGPSEINSIDVNQLMHYLKKKRKFQAEQLGLPISKHKCSDRRASSGRDSPSTNNPEEKYFNVVITEGNTDGGARDDGSEAQSAKDSNSFVADSFVEDTDSVMSISTETKIESGYATSSTYKQICTSSPKTFLYSLDSRSVRKSDGESEKSPYIGVERESPDDDFEFKTSLNFEEQLLELGNHMGYGYPDYGHDTEQCSDKELEDLMYSDNENPNNYVLSSGRWSVNRESQPDTKKLTIDKEFEQFFSTLML